MSSVWDRGLPRKVCDCPIYCKYCLAKLRRDVTGHYCPTSNCQWEHGVSGCYLTIRGSTTSD